MSRARHSRRHKASDQAADRKREASRSHVTARRADRGGESPGKVVGVKARRRLDRRPRRGYAEGGAVGAARRRETNPRNTSMLDIIRHGFDANPIATGRT